MNISRRDFIRGTIIGGAAITAVPTILIRKSPAEWAKRTEVHPNVSNLRVVGLTDPRMTKTKEVETPWKRQQELVVSEPVWENIDKLACALTETKDARDAWKGIFIKPPEKSWADTVVAIKTNNISRQHTRSAVMAKVCHSLVEVLGVKGENIFIYDGVHGSKMGRDTPFGGLPKGVRIVDQWGGISTPVAVPGPWEDPSGKSEIVKPLADGNVDILVNIALCKGHWTNYGGFTMAMKNHMGTFAPGPVHRDGAQDYLLAVNKTPEILGPMDKKTGKVLYPRQQLCLLDALWASKGGPDGLPTAQPNFLAMGVFAPVFDYLLATRFRGEKMGWKPNLSATKRFLSEFGYEEKDLPGGGKIVEI
jgi:Domain of unknown function (DUF362)